MSKDRATSFLVKVACIGYYAATSGFSSYGTLIDQSVTKNQTPKTVELTKDRGSSPEENFKNSKNNISYAIKILDGLDFCNPGASENVQWCKNCILGNLKKMSMGEILYVLKELSKNDQEQGFRIFKTVILDELVERERLEDEKSATIKQILQYMNTGLLESVIRKAPSDFLKEIIEEILDSSKLKLQLGSASTSQIPLCRNNYPSLGRPPLRQLPSSI